MVKENYWPKFYDKRDDFSFRIVNFPLICGNIISAPAYVMFISKVVRYARACKTTLTFCIALRFKLKDFWNRVMLLQDWCHDYKSFGRHHELVDHYGVYICAMKTDLFGVRVAHLLLLPCKYDFSYFMFFVVYVCFLCLVFVPRLHSFDYRYNLGSLDYFFSKKCWATICQSNLKTYRY